MNNPKFVLFRSVSDEEYYFRLQTRSGRSVLRSEGYNTRQECRNGIGSVRRNGPHDGRYEDRVSGKSLHYFVLKAENERIIGVSEMFPSSSASARGKAAVKRDAPKASVEERV